MRTLSFILIALFLGACTTSEKAKVCQEADWYELGRRDGAMGKPMRFEENQLPLLCQNSDQEKQQILFDIGRKAGLVEFCKPQNAYELGKEGKVYTDICPQETQTLFVEFYAKGNQVRELQEANLEIDSKIDVLFQQIRSLATDKKAEVELQISTLKNRKTQNNEEVENIEGALNL